MDFTQEREVRAAAGQRGGAGAKEKAEQVQALPWDLRVGSRGTTDAPTPNSRSCPSQLHTLTSALPSTHIGVFQLVGLGPECVRGSGRPVAVAARRTVPSWGPFFCEIANLPN